MKRFQSILCASLLTLSLSAAAFGGQISGRAGQISGTPGQISGSPGQISGLTTTIYSAILDLLIP
jgi:hypothetical protein